MAMVSSGLLVRSGTGDVLDSAGLAEEVARNQSHRTISAKSSIPLIVSQMTSGATRYRSDSDTCTC